MPKWNIIAASVTCAITFFSGANPGLASARCAVLPDDFMQLSDADRQNIENLDVSRMRGLAGALRAENSDERALVAALLEDGFEPMAMEKVRQGSYQCRTLKLGGNLPLVAYQWFACEIAPEEQVLTVRKVTGSQNFFGVMVPSGESLLYRGASHYGYEEQIRFYGDDPAHDQVGCFSAIDLKAGHFVLELPFPEFESVHDLIEFKLN